MSVMITLALCSSLTALAEYGWRIHQRAEENEQDCRHKIWMKDFNFLKNGDIWSGWMIGCEFFLKPIWLCFPESKESIWKFARTRLAPGYLFPNFKIYLKYSKI